jgi:hypothetical protein
LHRLSSAFVLGYHGCDKEVGNRLAAGEAFRNSENAYDWLGHGVYFWESNPARAIAFAREAAARGEAIDTPFVVGAVIDLGFCLDLTTTAGVEAVQAAYANLADAVRVTGAKMPANSGPWQRDLDCAVINHLHAVRARSNHEPFQTVKGVFLEGGLAYENSGFYAKTHIQLCVRDATCIKGVFHVRARA